MRLFLLASLLFAAGCGSTTTESGATDASVADTSSTIDAPGESSPKCTGKAPADCVAGTKGHACADVASARDCVAGTWTCAAATVPRAECGCMAGSPGPGAPPILPGDVCPPPIDAGVDVGPIDAGMCECIPSRLSWGNDGGFVAYVDRSSITPCRTYVHDRTPPGGGAPIKTCTREIPPCGAGDAIDMGDIRNALANGDVAAALAVAPVLYGKDPRAFDGQVLRIDYAGKVIEIGTDCGGTAGCKPIPPGVKSLGDLLRALDIGQLGLSPCKEAFTP